MVDDCPKKDTRNRHKQHVRPADNTRREHRFRLEIHPKYQRKPQKTDRHIGDERIYQNVIK